jgi:hypothetical protein
MSNQKYKFLAKSQKPGKPWSRKLIRMWPTLRSQQKQQEALKVRPTENQTLHYKLKRRGLKQELLR